MGGREGERMGEEWEGVGESRGGSVEMEVVIGEVTGCGEGG